jgi:hypothetical protein
MAAISRKLAQTFERETYTIGPGQTVNLDTVLYSALTSKKYIIDISIAAQNRFKAFEMLVSKKGTDVTDSIFAKLGDQVNVSVNFSKISTDAILAATNNEAVSVVLNILKI